MLIAWEISLPVEPKTRKASSLYQNLFEGDGRHWSLSLALSRFYPPFISRIASAQGKKTLEYTSTYSIGLEYNTMCSFHQS
jgi:hypothetical protein